MGFENDRVDCFLNSVEIVRNAFAPFEYGMRKVVKDIEHCWPGSKNGAKSVAVRRVRFVGDGRRRVGESLVSEEGKKDLRVNAVGKVFLEMCMRNRGSNGHREVELLGNVVKGIGNVSEDGNYKKLLEFVASWSLLLTGVVQDISSQFKTVRKRIQRSSDENVNWPRSSANVAVSRVSCGMKQIESKDQFSLEFCDGGLEEKERNNFPVECFIGFLFDQFDQNLQKIDTGVQEMLCKSSDSLRVPSLPTQFNHLKEYTGVLAGKRANFGGLLRNLKFARVGGVPSSINGATHPESEEIDGCIFSEGTPEVSGSKSAQKLGDGLVSTPLSNVENLRSNPCTVSPTEVPEIVPQVHSSKCHPDKNKLLSVKQFFRYTEAEGRRFFDELDRDGDGEVNLEDLEVAMRMRKLPQRYAHDLMHHTRSHLFSKSFGWRQFMSLIKEKEPTILQAYTSLCLSKSGALQKSEILASLKKAGLPVNEDSAVAMMRLLNVKDEDSISYGHFQDFVLLLPSDRLHEDPRNVWYEAATVESVAPAAQVHAGSVLKSAFAGGLACALSAFIMHPIDTIKTQVQASTTLTFLEIMGKLPQIGARGLYKGSIPTVFGQFTSHGLRTGLCEASKLVLLNVAPTLADIQVQSITSFSSTVFGTVYRVPCEVLKQRLQAGIFNNVGEALVGTWQQDGLKGFFRGTGATLCRELPFYVAGAGLYAESKKVCQKLLGRELEPWESILVGAISGGLAAVTTTPFDVIKTRMMTAPEGQHISMSIAALAILRHEGPLGLFKGAVPRFFWVAPLGAMNFAGYELIRKAMD